MYHKKIKFTTASSNSPLQIQIHCGSFKFQQQGFPSGGGGEWGDPYELYLSSLQLCPPNKIQKFPPPPPIFVDHDKMFLRYFFNLCMTKNNLTGITS